MLASLPELRTVVVVGAGTMGAGIAHVAALAGLGVTLVDVDAGVLDRALGRIREGLAGGVARGKLTAEAAAAALARIGAGPAPVPADIFFEAVPEDLELKRRTFATIDAVAPPHALFATNTSSLGVGAIARGTARPGSVVGMHFFNPVHVMKLVEIVRHDGSDPAAVALAQGLAGRLGKEAIVVRDRPGFASSRLGVLLGLEAARMLEEGVASAADLDRALRLGYGHPMGPLELGDLVGLDVRLAIAEHLARELGPRFEPPALLRQKVAAGELGKKTGRGFYRWEDGKIVGDG